MNYEDNIEKILHFIDIDNDNVLIYCNWIQEVIKVTSIGAIITKEYFSNSNDLEILANKYNIQKKQLIEYIENFKNIIRNKEKSKNQKKYLTHNGNNIEIKLNISHKCNLDCIYCYMRSAK